MTSLEHWQVIPYSYLKLGKPFTTISHVHAIL